LVTNRYSIWVHSRRRDLLILNLQLYLAKSISWRRCGISPQRVTPMPRADSTGLFRWLLEY
jgi:hypothetical protein